MYHRWIHSEHTFTKLSTFIENERIVANTIILFKYDFTDEDNNTKKTNVGIGKVVKVYEQHQSSCNEKGDGLRFDIKVCAPKQGKKGNLTNADIYRKNTEEDSFSTKFNLPIIKSQSREVLLAAGLTLNKNGLFSKMDRKNKWFNKTPAEVASAVLFEFYRSSSV